MVAQDKPRLQSGAANDGGVQLDDVGKVIACHDVVLQGIELGANADDAVVGSSKVDADLGIVVDKSSDLGLHILVRVDLDPEGLRVIERLAGVASTRAVDSIIQHVVVVWMRSTSISSTVLENAAGSHTEIVHVGRVLEQAHSS